MNTQTKITAFAFLLALFWLSYWLVAQSQAKESQRYLELQQQKDLLEQQIQEESESWWVDEYAKQECIDSWTKKQEDRSKLNDKRRTQIEKIDEEMGLLKSSQAQKKIKNSNLLEQEYTTNDTVGMTQDNKWYKKLLKWVGLT